MEAIVICVIRTIIGWLVFMLLGTNLLGMVVRGLISVPAAKNLEEKLHSALSGEIDKYKRANIVVTAFSVLLGVLYFYLLLRFWNFGVVLVAAVLMLSRLPDLLWEIRTGEKATLKSKPRGVIGILATIVMWAALPALYFVLC